MNKPSVTIGIPAFNEGKSIVKILNSLVSQTKENYTLDAIKVYSDGSVDNTVQLVRENFPEVTVVEHFTNRGKNIRVNEMLEDNASDVFVQVDADILIKDANTIDNLVTALVKNKKAGLVCSYHVAVEPTSFVGSLAYFGFRIWDTARNSLGAAGLRYYCEGGLRGFSKELAKEFRLPVGYHVGEDSYSFYYAIENGYEVVVCKEAIVYMNLVENIKDYIQQMKRFLLDSGMVVDVFNKNLTAKYEVLSTSVKLKALFEEFFKTPIIGICYIFLQAYTKFQVLFYKPSASWIPPTRK